MSQMERPLPAAIESTLRAVGQHLSPTHENILRAALVPEPREDGLRAVSREDLYEIIHEVREERHVNSAADDLTGVAWASLRAATPGDRLRESMQRELDSGWAVSEVLRRHGIRANIPVSSDD